MPLTAGPSPGIELDLQSACGSSRMTSLDIADAGVALSLNRL